MGKFDSDRTAAPDGMKPREPRRNVLIQARMRCDGVRTDVCIRNISSRGFLIQAANPPPRGSYIELFIGSFTIVGRIVWRKEHRFGVHTQTRMDVNALAGGFAPSRPAPGGVERSVVPRVALTLAETARRHDRSRQISLAIEFGCIAACGAAAAALAAGAVHEALSRPMQTISQHLDRES